MKTEIYVLYDQFANGQRPICAYRIKKDAENVKESFDKETNGRMKIKKKKRIVIANAAEVNGEIIAVY